MASVPEKGLRSLDVAACVRLLERHDVGRIAAGLEGWPAILPVNYVYAFDQIVFRTGFGVTIDEIPMQSVAFEIDGWDDDGLWGWSVLVQGPALDITEANDDLSIQLRALPLTPFAPGVKEHWIRIAAVRVSGRAFGPITA